MRKESKRDVKLKSIYMFLNGSNELLCSRRETGIGTDTDTKFSGKIGFQRQCLNLGMCVSDDKIWKHADSEIIGNHRDHHMIIHGGKTDIRFDAGFFQYLMDVIIDTFRGNSGRDRAEEIRAVEWRETTG